MSEDFAAVGYVDAVEATSERIARDVTLIQWAVLLTFVSILLGLRSWSGALSTWDDSTLSILSVGVTALGIAACVTCVIHPATQAVVHLLLLTIASAATGAAVASPGPSLGLIAWQLVIVGYLATRVWEGPERSPDVPALEAQRAPLMHNLPFAERGRKEA